MDLYRGHWVLFLLVLSWVAFAGDGAEDRLLACRTIPDLIAAAEKKPELAAQHVEVRYRFLPDPHRLRVAEGMTSEKNDQLVVIHDDPVLGTSLLTGSPELFEEAKEIWVMPVGMGGDVSKYGVAATTTPFGNTVRKRKGFPIAYQNWIYQGALTLSPAEREAKVAECSQMPFQMQKMSSFLTDIATASGDREVSMLTRSNGTAMGLQLVSEAGRDNAAALRAVRGVKMMILSGLNSPESPLFEQWTGIEDSLPAGTLDPYATQTDRNLYRASTFLKPAEGNFPPVDGLPLVVALITPRDEFVKQPDQISFMEKFHAMNPSVPVLLVYTDTEHDPLRGTDYKYRTPDMEKHKAMRLDRAARFWQVVDDVRRMEKEGTLPKPGELKRHVRPENALAQHLLPKPPKAEPTPAEESKE